MRTQLLRAALTLSAVAVLPVLASSPSGATDPTVAVGTFTQNLVGTSTFTETGGQVTLVGQYAGLKNNRSYFSVVYANGNCDPAQAFPVGPFKTNKMGWATANITVPDTIGNVVAGTMSISVRRGDNKNDLDHDGITGPGDVVAVPGKPSIGLIECDQMPVVLP